MLLQGSRVWLSALLVRVARRQNIPLGAVTCQSDQGSEGRSLLRGWHIVLHSGRSFDGQRHIWIVASQMRQVMTTSDFLVRSPQLGTSGYWYVEPLISSPHGHAETRRGNSAACPAPLAHASPDSSSNFNVIPIAFVFQDITVTLDVLVTGVKEHGTSGMRRYTTIGSTGIPGTKCNRTSSIPWQFDSYKN